MMNGKHERKNGLSEPVLLVHGGAWYIPDAERSTYIEGCRRAVQVGWSLLSEGGPALDAVERAVRVLEDDPTFDAGRGSYLNQADEVQMDAILMDGRSLDFGAVAAVRNVAHPISLARLVMERSEHRLIVGLGAEALAKAYRVPRVPDDYLLGKRDVGGWSPPDHRRAAAMHFGDTVGAVALDVCGNMAVATSTGGTPDKWPGRVGDSPLIGCGAYADNSSGAASATGSGESLMRIVTSKAACDLMGEGFTAQEAADRIITRLWDRVRGYGGVILIDPEGRVGLAHNTPNMAYAYRMASSEIVAGAEINRSAEV